jgi:hypothetical protein
MLVVDHLLFQNTMSSFYEFFFFFHSFFFFATLQRSCVRGHFKQSISAFRLAGVTSLLAALVQWPAIVGNLETFNYNDLWWWSDYEKCVDFHTGLPFLTPDHYQSTQYCNDSRWGTAGALMTFLAMHCNILACAAVYVNNQVCKKKKKKQCKKKKLKLN